MIRLLAKERMSCRSAGLLRAIILVLAPVAGYGMDADTATGYVVDPSASIVRVYVYRGGLLGLLGHDHIVSTNDIKGVLNYAPPPSLSAHFKITLPVDKLVVDDPEERKAAGDKFSSQVSDEDRSATRRHMLSSKVLDAERYPKIEIEGDWIKGSPPHGTIAAIIGAHGTQREYHVPVDIKMQNGHLLVKGSIHILQTDFGITPLNVAGGLIQVANGLDVRFALAFIRSDKTEPPPN